MFAVLVITTLSMVYLAGTMLPQLLNTIKETEVTPITQEKAGKFELVTVDQAILLGIKYRELRDNGKIWGINND